MAEAFPSLESCIKSKLEPFLTLVAAASFVYTFASQVPKEPDWACTVASSVDVAEGASPAVGINI